MLARKTSRFSVPSTCPDLHFHHLLGVKKSEVLTGFMTHFDETTLDVLLLSGIRDDRNIYTRKDYELRKVSDSLGDYATLFDF